MKGITLQQAPQVAIMLVLIGLIIGAGALALTAFQSSVSSSGAAVANASLGNVTSAISNVAAQFPTIGTIIGVIILIVVVITGFSWAMGRKEGM